MRSFMHAPGKLEWIGAVVRAALWVVGATACAKQPAPGPTPASQTEAAAPVAASAPVEAPPAEPSAATTSPPSADSAPLQAAWVESAEADEIHVRSLTAIVVEATEIVAPKREQAAGNPTPKELGWGRLQGHLIRVDELTAHHVRARRIVADRIEARTFKPLAGALRWSPAPSANAIVNQCVSALDGGVSSACFKERAF